MRRSDAKRRFVPAISDDWPPALPNAWWSQLWGWRSVGVATGLGGYIERRHALGLKAPGGRPSGRWWKRPANERERTLRRMADLIDKLPAPPKKPIEHWTLPERLTDTARMGLVQLHGIISQPLQLKQAPDDRLDPSELKLQRLVGELALGADRLLARVQDSDLRQQQHDDWLEAFNKKLDEAEAKLLQVEKRTAKD